MSNILKGVIIFVAGGAVGATCGIFGTKKYYQKKYKKQADEKIASVERYNEKLKAELKKAYKNGAYSETLGYVVDKEPEKEKVEEGKAPETEKIDYWEVSNKAHKKKVLEKKMQEMAEKEHPTEDDIDEKEEIFRESEILRQKELNESMNDSDPYVMTEEEDAVDAISSRETLYYIMEDDMMYDEEDNLVPDYRRLVGDLIQDTGFNENEEDEIIIKNPSLGVIFTVSKVPEGDYY